MGELRCPFSAIAALVDEDSDDEDPEAEGLRGSKAEGQNGDQGGEPRRSGSVDSGASSSPRSAGSQGLKSPVAEEMAAVALGFGTEESPGRVRTRSAELKAEWQVERRNSGLHVAEDDEELFDIHEHIREGSPDPADTGDLFDIRETSREGSMVSDEDVAQPHHLPSNLEPKALRAKVSSRIEDDEELPTSPIPQPLSSLAPLPNGRKSGDASPPLPNINEGPRQVSNMRSSWRSSLRPSFQSQGGGKLESSIDDWPGGPSAPEGTTEGRDSLAELEGQMLGSSTLGALESVREDAVKSKPRTYSPATSPHASFSRRTGPTAFRATSDDFGDDVFSRLSSDEKRNHGGEDRSPLMRSPMGSFVRRRQMADKPQSSSRLVAQGSFAKQKGAAVFEKMGGYGSTRNIERGASFAKMGSMANMGNGLASRGSSNVIVTRGNSVMIVQDSQAIMVGEKKKTKKKFARTKKYVTFSRWEAESFAPLIKLSWSRAMQVATWAQLSDEIQNHLFISIPELEAEIGGLEGLGVQFAENLHDIIQALDSKKELEQKVPAFGATLTALDTLYLNALGAALKSTLHEFLEDDFNVDVEAAWSWMWSWLSRGLEQAIKQGGKGPSAITQAWDTANDNFTEEELGVLFYDTLFDFAPNLKTLFRKPKPVLALQFFSLMGTFVSLQENNEKTEETILLLALSHVKYGARRQHTTVMCQVLVSTIEKAIGKEWNPDISDVWTDKWNQLCDKLMTVIEEAEQFAPFLKRTMLECQKGLKLGQLGYFIFRRLASKDPDMIQDFSAKCREGEMEMPERRPPPGSAVYLESREGEGSPVHGQHKAANGTLSSVNEGATANGNGDVALREAEQPMDVAGSSIIMEKIGRTTSSIGTGIGTVGSSIGQGVNALTSKAAKKMSTIVQGSKTLGSTIGKGFMQSQNKRMKDPFESMAVMSSEHELIGIEFWDLLVELVERIFEPDMLLEKVTLLAARYQKMGLRIEHIDALGNGIHDTFKYMFGDAWGEPETAAWIWVWDVCEKLMRRSFICNSEQNAALISDSWTKAKEKMSPEEIGENMFLELARIAPYTLHIFKRPRKIQALQFVNAIEMLILFTKDVQAFFEDLQSITVRHIKYGVKTDYIQPFGQAIIAALAKALTDDWDPHTNQAWELLFENVSSFMSRALSSGTSLVNAALVQGNLDKLIDAVECCPRGERAKVLTEVEVHGVTVSPLYWAIRDGKFAMAKYIIDDLLAIRADRDRYYYGREKLWDSHPDIVHVLCQECPMLLEDVFDGHMWHSHTVLEGFFRVNFYVKELYGNPDDYPDPWESPLSTLVLEGHPEMFKHPVIEKLLDLKWRGLARQGFILLQIYFGLVLLFFIVGYISNGDDCSSEFVGIRLFTGALAALAFLAMTVLIIRQHRAGQIGLILLPFIKRKARIPRFCMNSSNMLRYVSYGLLMVVSVSEVCWRDEALAARPSRRTLGCPGRTEEDVDLPDFSAYQPSWDMLLTGFCTFALFIQEIQLLTLSRRLAAFTYSIGHMFADVSRNLILILVIGLSFAAAITVMEETEFPSMQIAAVLLLKAILGLAPPNSEELRPSGLILMICFIVIIDIGFLNILIAQLALSYETLKQDTEGYANMNRGFNCIEIESFVPVWVRRKLWLVLDFDRPLEFDQGDEGPSGGVQQQMPASHRAHPRYIPDRILRFTGVASPHDPWPREGETEGGEGG